MLTWSARRRAAYFLLAAAVLVALGVALYWYTKPAPSCLDGKQNGNELGPDCGGDCPQVCPREIQPVRVIWSRVFRVAADKYDVAALLENPNRSHGVKILPYVVRVLDADGILVTLRPGRTYLNPEERIIVFESRLGVGQRVPARAILELPEPPVWRKMTETRPELTVTSRGFNNQPWPRLVGSITNQSLQPLTEILVAAVLADPEGNALAVSSTLVERLEAGESRELVYTWPEPFGEEPTTIEFYPHFDLTQLSG